MSVYRCNHCEKVIDSDYEGCEGDPRDDCALLCLDCFYEISVPTERVYTEEFRDLMIESGDEDYDGPGDEYYEMLMHREHSA